MIEEQIFKIIREQAKQYEEYNNFDREDLIDELVEEKRINEANLDLINNYKERIDKAIEYIEKAEMVSKNRTINILKGEQ